MKIDRLSRLAIVVCASVAAGAGGCGCPPPPMRPDLVTINGIVINVDKGVPAVGVRVSLLGTSYTSAVPTGSDGAYTIQVPKGSTLLLHTDDFNAGTDVWFPLINVDMPAIKVDQMIPADKMFWLIHACPQTKAPDSGSVALWDEYLANADDQLNGNLFAANSSANSGGVITCLAVGCENTQIAFYDSMSISSNLPNSPIGYIKDICGKSNDPHGAASCLYPSSRAATDSSGWVVAFCDSAGTETAATLTFQDFKAGRNLMWPPFEVPVRRGTITLVWAVAINGVANKYFKEAARCAGLLP